MLHKKSGTRKMKCVIYFSILAYILVVAEGKPKFPNFRDLPIGRKRAPKTEKEVSCGTHQIDPASSGYRFQSPLLNIGFNPSAYECTWRFLGTQGCTPIINCNPFKLGSKNECTNEYLEASDGSGDGEKFCGSNGPKNISSSNSILIAHLKLGYFNRDRNFQCTVTCVTPETQVNQILPTHEPETTDCNCGEPGPVVESESYSNSHRIVNGVEAQKGYWRWQVGMVFRNGKSPFCGGSLISDRFVLTAAHCVVTTGLVSFPGAAEVVLNDYNFTETSDSQTIRRSIIAITSHPFYNPNTQDYDVAVLELNQPVDMKATEEPMVRPVCLPQRNVHDTYVGENATVIGWGATTEGGDQSEVIMQVAVPVIDQEECNKQYDNKITARMICGAYPEGGKDSCQGDSGGPYMKMDDNGRWTEIGVVSWGEGCAREGKPGVYARVTEVNDWIRMTARRGVWCQEA